MRLERFFANLQKDLKVFLFLLVVICFYRAYFMAYMSEAIAPTTSMGDVLLALWLGFRLSLKSAGAMFSALCQNLFCRSCGCLVCGFGSERRRVGFLPCSFRRGFRIMRFFMRRSAGMSCRGCMRICRRFSRCWLNRMRCRCAFLQLLF